MTHNHWRNLKNPPMACVCFALPLLGLGLAASSNNFFSLAGMVFNLQVCTVSYFKSFQSGEKRGRKCLLQYATHSDFFIFISFCN